MKRGHQKNSVTEALIAFIEEKKLGLGDRLPPERKLAEMFGVSRNTVREAIRELETKGRVKTKSGSGCFVTRLEDKANWDSLRDTTDAGVLKDHMEARVAIEPLIVCKAVERSTDKDIKTLKQIMVGLSNAIINRDSDKTGDAIIAFGRAVSEISGNRFFILIIQEMELEKHILSRVLSGCSDDRIQAIFKNRVELINCFKNRDAATAAEQVRASLEERYRLFGELNG